MRLSTVPWPAAVWRVSPGPGALGPQRTRPGSQWWPEEGVTQGHRLACGRGSVWTVEQLLEPRRVTLMSCFLTGAPTGTGLGLTGRRAQVQGRQGQS